VIVPEAEKSESMFMRQNQIVQRKFIELDSLLAHVPFYQAIVFINHRGRAGDLVKFLNRQGYPAMHITAGISQQERLDVMAKARKFEIRVLVCSDLVSLSLMLSRAEQIILFVLTAGSGSGSKTSFFVYHRLLVELILTGST
jgi:superfamily II DNA/RNA helicase